MSEAGRDWTALGKAAGEDAGLASLAAGGGLLLWDSAAGRPGFADAGARALLGPDARAITLPGPTRQRLALLAGGLASRDGVRLERLRLTAGFSAALATCGCKLLAWPDGEAVLAIAIPAGEMRRLGVAIAPPEPTIVEPAPEPTTTIAPAAIEPAAPRRATARFLWTSDAAGRVTSVSRDFADLAGEQGEAAIIGRNWAELIGSDLLDRDGGLADRLIANATWSGHRVLWRSDAPTEGVRVELSGVPVLDAARVFSGFRGFGLARLHEREPFPVAEQAGETAATTASHDHDDPAAWAPDADDDALAGGEPAAAAENADAEAAGTPAEQRPAANAAVPPSPDAPSPDVPPPAAADREPQPPLPGANIVPLRNGHLTAVRPVLEPSKLNLSSAERNAFREIAKALGARIAGDEEMGPRLPPVAPLRLKEDAPPQAVERTQPLNRRASDAQQEPESAAEIAAPIETMVEAGSAETQRQRVPNSHADVLDRLPIAVLVNRGDAALYANRTLLDLLDYADLDDLVAGGSVSRLIKEASRTDGGAMILIDRLGHLVSVDAVLSSIAWQGEPATLMAFRHPDGGGEVRVLSPEEAEEAELAAEFAAEEAESAARIEALRLDVGAREGRISELVAMLDTATDGVVTVDERGRILSLNKTAEALFGYDQREVTGELFTLLFSAESHAPALDYLEGLKGGGVASVMNDGREIVGRVRQGGKIPLFMTMGQIADTPERRFCAVLRDITAWKKTEGELVEARKAAEKASAQKSDVLAKISHEIRTPLNAIIGFAEVMAEERFGPIANERYKEYLRDIHQSGGYVISLVNDLLDLAKIEAGKLDLDFVSVNLNEIALLTVALLQPEANRGRVVLRSGLSPKLPPVVADQRSIRQIVINLLSNAVKFTDAGGQVIVSTALGDQGEAILRVRDTGIGMDDGEIALALEPFRQVPATRRAGGTGLGLPLTKALVEANRAAMSITSVKKEGTLVEITFPPQRVLAG
jgi:PAS domain S-box-containing protein